jgi:hypothetical protein
MINFRKHGPAIATAMLLVVANAATSQAFHTGEPYDALELKCRSTIAKTFTKAVQTGQKIIATCHKTRDKSGGAADCNVLDLANADPKGKFTKATGKIASGVQKSCIDSGISLDIVKEYISCPQPCETDLGLPNPLTSYSEIAQCLGCYAGQIAEDFSLASQGLPAAPMSSSTDQNCHASIAKGFGKYLATIMKERTKCQNTAEKGGAIHLEDTGCLTADPKGKIATALTKANSIVSGACAAATLANLDSCSDVDLASLESCLKTEAETSADAGVAGSYELDATICPAGIDSLVRGRHTVTGDTTTTRLELGWTGLAHSADLQDNYYISVDISCPNPGPPCGTCTIDGISPAGKQYQSFLRCTNNIAQECTLPFQNDPACGGSLCAYVLGPPLPVSAGNNPVCSINRLKQDITGTSDPDAGAGALSVALSTLVHLGEGLTSPCPVCVGDTTPLDGVKNGTCTNGPNNGQPCDIQGYSATFAAGSNNEGLSLDCPPSQLANISGSGLNIPLELTTGATILPFENSCDSPLGFLDCACGMCSGQTDLPCRNDQECIDAGAGTCTSIGSGVARVPNDCADGVCTPVGDKGTCEAGPNDTYCDGALNADGDGYIGCATNADCAAVNSECQGNNCGSCTDAQERPCFADPILAVGTPDVENPVLVSTFCLPPTSNAAINGVSGSPGPVRVRVDQLTELRY